MPTITIDLDDIVCFAKTNEALSFAEIRNAPANFTYRAEPTGGVLATIALATTSTQNQFLILYRTIATFDTSGIPSGSTIVSATLEFPIVDAEAGLGVFDCCLTGCSPSNPASIVLSDGSTFIDTDLAPRIGIVDAYNAEVVRFVLNATGRSYINTSGYTPFMLRLSWDVDNSFTGTWSSAQASMMQNAAFFPPPNDYINPRLIIEYEEGSGVGEVVLVEGTTSATSGMAGTLSANVPLRGSVAALTGAAATATRVRRVAGAVAAQSACNGVCKASVPVSGTVEATTIITATFGAEVFFRGSVSATSNSSGGIVRIRTAKSQIPGNSTLAGYLSAPVPLSGSCAAHTGGNGSLAAGVPIAGTIQVQSSGAGALQAGRAVPVAGICSAISGLTAFLNGTLSLNGAVSSIIVLTGIYTRIRTQSGILSGSSGAAGHLRATTSLSGSVAAASGTGGAVQRLNGLAGLCTGTTGLEQPSLAARVPLVGNVGATSSGSGTLSTSKEVEIFGDVIATASVEGTVQPIRGLSGEVAALGSGSGALSRTVAVSGTSAEVSSISANCGVRIAVSGGSQAVSQVTGHIEAENATELSGTVSAASINTGTINRGRSLSGETVSGVVSLSGAITTPIALRTEVQAVSLAQADLSNSIPIASVVTARSGIAGVLGVRSTRTVVTTARSLAATTSRQGRAERLILACIQAVHGNAATLRSQTVVVATYLSRITAELEIRIKTLKVKDFKVFEADLDFAAGEAGLDFGAGELESDFMAVEAASSEGFMVMELELDFQVIEV